MNRPFHPDKTFIKEILLFFLLPIFLACNTNSKENIPKADSAIVINPYFPPYLDTTKTLKENVLLEYLLTSKTVKPNLTNGAPFDTLHYDKIIAYDFAGSEEPYPGVVDKKNKFVPVVLAQQFLTQIQADKILSVLSKNSTYGEVTAACFDPHFALLFLRDNEIINSINICLDCNYLISDIPIPAETHLKVNKGTSNEYAYTGFTRSGKRAIINLCKELNFTYGAYQIK